MSRNLAKNRYAFRFPIQGINPVITANALPETVWTAGGLYPWSGFASGPLAMTVESTSTDDDGLPAGTGAQIVQVLGLDDKFRAIYSQIVMNGTTPVACGTFNRILAVAVTQAGSGETNAGDITVENGGTVYAHMRAGDSSAQMGIFTVPEVGIPCEVRRWWARVVRAQGSVIQMGIRIRLPGSTVWTMPQQTAVHSYSGWERDFEDLEAVLPAGTDLELRVLQTSAAVEVISGLDFGFRQAHDYGTEITVSVASAEGLIGALFTNNITP